MPKKPNGDIEVTNDERRIIIKSEVEIEAECFMLRLGVLDGKDKPTCVATPPRIELDKPKKEIQFENWPSMLKMHADHPKPDASYILEVYMFRNSKENPICIQHFAYRAEVLAKTLGVSLVSEVGPVSLANVSIPVMAIASKGAVSDNKIDELRVWLTHIKDTASRMKIYDHNVPEAVPNGLRKVEEEITGLRERFQDPRLDELTMNLDSIRIRYELMIHQQKKFQQRQLEKLVPTSPSTETPVRPSTKQEETPNAPEPKPEAAPTFSAEQAQKMMEDAANKAKSEVTAEMKAQARPEPAPTPVATAPQTPKPATTYDTTQVAQMVQEAVNKALAEEKQRHENDEIQKLAQRSQEAQVPATGSGPSLRSTLWQSTLDLPNRFRSHWKTALTILIILIGLVWEMSTGWGISKKVASIFKSSTPVPEAGSPNPSPGDIPVTPENDPARPVAGAKTNSLSNPARANGEKSSIYFGSVTGSNTITAIVVLGDYTPLHGENSSVKLPYQNVERSRKDTEFTRTENIVPSPDLRVGESDNIVVKVSPYEYIECVYTKTDGFDYDRYIRRLNSATGQYEEMPVGSYRSGSNGNVRWFKNNSSDEMVIGFKCTKT